ncbi:MAG TPA: chemotaxis protein CheW [Edaphobacter sp.]
MRKAMKKDVTAGVSEIDEDRQTLKREQGGPADINLGRSAGTIQDEEDTISLCSISAGEQSFGIDTRRISEVLGGRELQRVPMAPAFIGGVVPYRGEVLTTVSFRALLGLTENTEANCVLVLEDEDASQRFGLVVDSVGGVVTVNRKMLETNPSTLDARGRWLFDGAYKMQSGLLVQLDPQRLQPSRLAEMEIFRQNGGAV